MRLEPDDIDRCRRSSRCLRNISKLVLKDMHAAEMMRYRNETFEIYIDSSDVEIHQKTFEDSGCKIIDAKIVRSTWKGFYDFVFFRDTFGYAEDSLPSKYHLSRMLYACLLDLFGNVVTFTAVYCYAMTCVDNAYWPITRYIVTEWANDMQKIYGRGQLVPEDMFIVDCEKMPIGCLWHLVHEMSCDDPENQRLVDWNTIPSYSETEE